VDLVSTLPGEAASTLPGGAKIRRGAVAAMVWQRRAYRPTNCHATSKARTRNIFRTLGPAKKTLGA